MAKLFLDVAVGRAVASLDFAGERVTVAGNDLEIAIGQLAPQFLDPPVTCFQLP